MKVSVIIPTFQGEKKIVNLLKALCEQQVLPDEVIIVVDGSTDDTIEKINSFDRKILNIKVIEQSNQGRSIARNNGVKESTGDIIIFYDDDVTPYKNSVKLHKEFHAQHFGIVTGIQVDFNEKDLPDIQKYKAYLSRNWIKKYADGKNKLELDNLFFTTANCSMLKHVFFEIGMFETRLSDGEDFELAVRAIKNNFTVFLDKENTVLHHDTITIRSYIARIRQYRKAHQQILTLHPELKKSSKSNFFKSFIYRIFTCSFFLYVAESQFISILPTPFRYKYYSIIIHAFSAEFPAKPIP